MRNKHKDKILSERAIDKIVVAQADDDSAWEKPVRVRRAKPAALPLPSELAMRAAFFARLHRETNVNDWLKRIIRERIDLEEAAFAGLKRELAAKNGA
ncbi:hypothetical protein HUU05_02805 [candidate division KSB1 bacterium]|nr:hypothetical protein [candidate division KSB1 bacterium]